MTILQKDIETNLKNMVLEYIWKFIDDEESYDLALSWVDKGYIHPKTNKNSNLSTLSA